MRSRTGWQRARASKRTCARVLAGNQHVLQSEHAFAYWLATSTCFKANMRSRTGWQPTRPLKQTCVRVLAAYFPTPSPYSMLIFLNICFDFFNVQGFFVWNILKNEISPTFSYGVPKSLARMRVFLFFSAEGRNVCFPLEERLFSNPFPPIQCWRDQGDFSKVGKFREFWKLMPTWSDVLKFGHCIDRCLRLLQHWIGGRGW